ncbi:methyltransferase domain-containing protein [bacterium]|nr:methyltransferase domain-containing protein [bacterium]
MYRSGDSYNGQNTYVSGVRAYYEQNTTWFSLVRRRNHNPAIHRPVWADGVAQREDALNFVNAQIAQQVEALRAGALRNDTAITMLDLGCGFGATVHYLGRRFGEHLSAIGMTISRQQARIAQDRTQSLGLQNCAFIEGDFQSVPICAEIDLICSIEAFAHAYAPDRYMVEAARLLKPGGRLILCDDFRAASPVAVNGGTASARWLALFQEGWHVPHLLTPQDVSHLAQTNGLTPIANIDFSPYLHMRPFPRVAIPLFEAAMHHSGALTATFESVLGGFALEECIRQGLVQYRFLVFEKTTDDRRQTTDLAKTAASV